MSEALKPCPNPWCKSDPEIKVNWKLVFGGKSEPKFYAVICRECGVQGPWEYSENDALAAWNRRAPSEREAKLVEALEEISHMSSTHKLRLVATKALAAYR